MRALLTYHSIAARAVATRARVIGFVLLGIAGLIVAWRVAASHPFSVRDAAVTFSEAFGLGVVAPLTALVFASAVLGDPVEDGTLVYLWARPQPRWRLAVGAWSAALRYALPLAVVPIVAGGATIAAATSVLVESGGPSVVGPILLAALLSVVCYASLFCWLGLLTTRALVWGIGYILIIENFVARGGRSLGFLSVHAHAASILADGTDVDLRLGYFGASTSVAWLCVVSVLALGFTARRLRTGDVA